MIVSILFACNASALNNNSEDDILYYIDQSRVIKDLFNTIKSNELKKEKFMVVLYTNRDLFLVDNKPTDLIAWFKYSNNNEYITVYYFPFYDIMGASYNNYLKKIIDNKGFVNIGNARQLEMSLPKGLKNDILFDKMRKEKRTSSRNYFFKSESFHLGFKSNKVEFVFDSYSFSKEVKDNVLMPIVDAIYKYEKDLREQNREAER
jgi:hypothetical protein